MSKGGDQRITRRLAMKFSFGALGIGLTINSRSETAVPAQPPAPNVDDTPRGRFFEVKELALLSEVVELIIPTTDTPGARAADVHGFLDNLMADWALPETQTEFRVLLGEIDGSAKRRFGARFMDLIPQHQITIISEMDSVAYELGKNALPLLTNGRTTQPFARFKALVFLGYYHSEIGATQELQFELIPGHYEACLPLSSVGRAWVGGYWEDQGAYAQSLAL